MCQRIFHHAANYGRLRIFCLELHNLANCFLTCYLLLPILTPVVPHSSDIHFPLQYSLVESGSEVITGPLTIQHYHSCIAWDFVVKCLFTMDGYLVPENNHTCFDHLVDAGGQAIVALVTKGEKRRDAIGKSVVDFSVFLVCEALAQRKPPQCNCWPLIHILRPQLA